MSFWGQVLSVCLWGVVALSCDSLKLAPVPTDVEVVPTTLDFGRVYLGSPKTRVLTVRNRSRRTLNGVARTTAPFAVATEWRVESGGTVELLVTASTNVEQMLAGTVEIVVNDQTVSVPISGSALPIPQCERSGPCATAAFDVEPERCVSGVVESGTECSTPCIEQGFCQDGQCIGTAKRCDDNNACTADGCGADGSCTHVDISGTCGAGQNPCEAGRCDTKLGCVTVTVPDGTACGASNCATSFVCMEGSCEAEPTPEGSSCETGDTCSGRGVCRQQTCVPAGPPKPPETAWTYQISPEAQVDFRGVSDAFGNVYWTERIQRASQGAYYIASVNSRGELRFREPLAELSFSFGHVLAGDRLYLLHGQDIWVVSAVDGKLTSDPGIIPLGSLLKQNISIQDIVVDAAREVLYARYAQFGFANPSESRWGQRAAVNLKTGALMWSSDRGQQWPEVAGGLTILLDGKLHWSERAGPNPFGLSTFRLVTTQPDGSECCRREVTDTRWSPVAAFAGRLLLAGAGIHLGSVPRPLTDSSEPAPDFPAVEREEATGFASAGVTFESLDRATLGERSAGVLFTGSQLVGELAGYLRLIGWAGVDRTTKARWTLSSRTRQLEQSSLSHMVSYLEPQLTRHGVLLGAAYPFHQLGSPAEQMLEGSAPVGTQMWIEHRDDSGKRRFVCPLAFDREMIFRQHTALLPRLLVVARESTGRAVPDEHSSRAPRLWPPGGVVIEALKLDDAEPAESGWLHVRGDVGRSGAPQSAAP